MCTYVVARMGMLPPEVDISKIHRFGNCSSVLGALASRFRGTIPARVGFVREADFYPV